MRWRLVREAPRYLISNTGEVWDTKRKRYLAKTYNRGYLQVTLFPKFKKKLTRKVHRLVADAFIRTGDTVNHIDGVKDNNNLENLEVVTIKENIHHAIALGLRNGCTHKGEKHGMNRYKESDILTIIELSSKIKNKKEISRITGISYDVVIDVILNRSWKHLPR